MCSPALLSQEQLPVDVDSLHRYTWLHATPEHSDWTLWLEQIGYDGHVALQNQRFATLDLAVSAAIQGFGIAVGDVTLAQQDLDAGRLILPYPQRVASGKCYYLVRPNTAPNPSLTLLFDWILSDVSAQASA